jgi:radical SAM protein with 4Fe4S-binding SPASM domain
MNIFKLRDVAPQIPNLLFRNTFKFHFEKLPFEAQDLTFKKKWNFLVAGFNQYFLPAKPFGRPVIVQVEPSNVCNLGCSLCLSASFNHERKAALLPFEVFRKFIDEIGDTLLLMIFWNWGEPFLNPDAIKMIAYATSKGVLVHTSTNGNVVFSDEMADRIVQSKLTSMIFAVDGATQETYSKYRAGGNLERVKQNIRTVIKAKERNHSQYPMVTVRFVAMQPNEQEMKDVEKLARELGADNFAIKSVDMPPARGEQLDEKYRPEQDSLRRYEYEEGSFTRKARPFECMRPWKRLTLDALGEVISCEYDYKDTHSFGNIAGSMSVIDTWKSQVSRQFRAKFHKGHNNYYHCVDCTYKNLRGEDCILDAYPLRNE